MPDQVPPDAPPPPPGAVGRSVSIDHAASLLRVSRRTVYNYIASGKLQTIRTLGGSQRVLMASIAALPRGLKAP